MPLLSPSQIHAVLQAERSAPVAGAGAGAGAGELKKLLSDASLTPEEVLENLSSLLRSGETDSVRLRAAETALKLNGFLDNRSAEGQNFSVTINIIDSEFDINPILIPRGVL